MGRRAYETIVEEYLAQDWVLGLAANSTLATAGLSFSYVWTTKPATSATQVVGRCGPKKTAFMLMGEGVEDKEVGVCITLFSKVQGVDKWVGVPGFDFDCDLADVSYSTGVRLGREYAQITTPRAAAEQLASGYTSLAVVGAASNDHPGLVVIDTLGFEFFLAQPFVVTGAGAATNANLLWRGM